MKTTLFLLAGALAVSAQNITIPATDGSLPAGGANGCAAGYEPGTDTVLFTVPYTYTQVLSIIGNYTNLTWSGSPDNSVTTNCSSALSNNAWVPGCARTYDVAGAHVIETITVYDKPATGPYVEVHTLAPLSIPSAGLLFYGDYDAQLWQPICGGAATTTNFTINFCANNATAAAAVLHGLHLTDAQTVGKFLGGQNFTSCAALNGTGTSGGSSTPSVVPYTGAAVAFGGSALAVGVVAGAVAFAAAML